ncbi:MULTISPECIES: ABC transporter permease [unclassified Embleya]|uniref:ABC transporter permease n=1 Tax=unclassified Embleya TaxID=2699296 RepID=UPI00368C2087
MVARRLAAAPVVLLAVTFLVFALGAASPFDPVRQYAGDAAFTASARNLEQIRAGLGADRPFVAQWWSWLGDALTGDLGASRSLRMPVGQVIGERLGWTVLLVSVAFVLTLVGGMALGILAARRRGGVLDRCVTGAMYTLEAAPVFWLALGAVWLFALRLDLLPAGGLTDTSASVVTADQVGAHLVLPAAVLAVSQLPWFVLYIRQSLIAALAEEHVLGARARGLRERTVLLRHALRSALLPFLTLLGSRVPELITGALLVETVFSWPGVASATVQAALALDFPLLTALTVLATAAVLIGNLAADVLYGLADPRVALDG